MRVYCEVDVVRHMVSCKVTTYGCILLPILDMLGGGSCHGVKVLVEYCSQKKLQRKHEKYHTFCTLGNVLR